MNELKSNLTEKYQDASDQIVSNRYAELLDTVNNKDFVDHDLDGMILEMGFIVDIMKQRRLSFAKAYTRKTIGGTDRKARIKELNTKLMASWNRMVRQAIVGMGVGIIPLLIMLWLVVVSGSEANLLILFILGIIPFLSGLSLLTFSVFERAKHDSTALHVY